MRFSGDPLGAIFLGAIITQPLKPVEQRSHPAGRTVLRGSKTAQQNAIRVEVIERSMSAPECHTTAGFFDQPSGVNITVAQADEDGCRIECDPCVAPDNSLQSERIAMVQRL